ncbi:MAG: polysaccharide deacetylase family protein [Hydrogenothermaceae bacterium]
MKFLNVSIHDVTASNEEYIMSIIDILENIGIDKISFLVVPYFHSKEKIYDISDDLKEIILKNEVVLHGYTHSGERFSFFSYKNLLTNKEGEFLSYKDTEDRIAKGLEILRSFGFNPCGFIPPAWLMRKEDFSILKSLGFRFTTDRLRIYDIQNEKSFFSPVLTFSSRSFMEEPSIYYFKFTGIFVKTFLNIVRVAIHPPDVKNRRKIQILNEFIKSLDNFKLVYFEEILNLST